MLDPKLIRNNLEDIAKQLKQRGVILDSARMLILEDQRKSLQTQLQDLQNERNVHSKAVGQAKAKGENVDALLTKMKTLSENLKETEEKFNAVQDELNHFLAMIPNIPHSS